MKFTPGTRVVYVGGDTSMEQPLNWLRPGALGTIKPEVGIGKYTRVAWDDNTEKHLYPKGLPMLPGTVERYVEPEPIGRPKAAEQDVAILEALGYKKLPYAETHKNGALMSEEFRTFGSITEPVRRITLHYGGMHKDICRYCGREGLLIDRDTHDDYHIRRGDRIGAYKGIWKRGRMKPIIDRDELARIWFEDQHPQYGPNGLNETNEWWKDRSYRFADRLLEEMSKGEVSNTLVVKPLTEALKLYAPELSEAEVQEALTTIMRGSV